MTSESEQPKPSNAAEASTTAMDLHTATGSGGSSLDFSVDFGQSSQLLSKQRIKAGDSISKYEVRSTLGVGGMGIVFLAFDTLIERNIALKLLSQEASASKVAVQRFLQEARAVGKLNHPNVVSIYDIDRWNNQYFIVMELISGGSLSQIVRREGPLNWQRSCQLVAQAAEGLHAAHQANLIHRDIKPENLMLTQDGNCKVVDFGLSKISQMDAESSTAVTKAGHILGTPQYMSPEQFAGIEVDYRTDIYSLGGTLHFLLTGKYPYHEANNLLQMMNAHATQPPPSAQSLVPSLPPAIEKIICKAMAKRPEERFSSASEMADALRNSLITSPETHARVSMEKESPPTLRNLLIVEPSKTQATVLQRTLQKLGVPSLTTVSSIKNALQSIAQIHPEIVLTSLRLDDGSGLELIRHIRQIKSYLGIVTILNSNDSEVDELLEVSPSGTVVLCPKKSSAEQLLKLISATTGLGEAQPVLDNSVDLSNARLTLISESESLPETLSELIRRSGVLDVNILHPEKQSLETSRLAPSVQFVLTMNQQQYSRTDYVRLAQRFSKTSQITVAIASDQGNYRIQAASLGGILLATDTELSLPCLTRLLALSIRPML